MSDTLPQIKVCGITSLHDAQLAVELGAWAVGMVFYEPSPRACSMGEALRIVAALRRKVELCGVFVNAPLDEVVQACDELGLTMLQLHGDEGPAYCAEVGHRTGAKVIKAVQVESIGEVRDVERFHTDFHLLDARSAAPGKRELRGGTGEAFDWGLLAARRSKVPLILSGGLGPGERGAGDHCGLLAWPSRATLRAGHRQRHGGGPGAQGPRAAARVLRCGARLRTGGCRTSGCRTGGCRAAGGCRAGRRRAGGDSARGHIGVDNLAA